MGRISLLAICAVLSGTADAFAFCLVPDAPYCATRGFEFTDKWEFESCRSKMKSYRSDVEMHMQCVQDEYNDAVKQFNRKASN